MRAQSRSRRSSGLRRLAQSEASRQFVRIPRSLSEGERRAANALEDPRHWGFGWIAAKALPRSARRHGVVLVGARHGVEDRLGAFLAREEVLAGMKARPSFLDQDLADGATEGITRAEEDESVGSELAEEDAHGSREIERLRHLRSKGVSVEVLPASRARGEAVSSTVDERDRRR